LFFRIVGNLVILGALVVLAYVGVILTAPAPSPESSSPSGLEVGLARYPSAIDPGAPETVVDESLAEPPPEEPAEAIPDYAPIEPITWVRLPRLGIDAEVVQSKFVQLNDGGTWLIPAFKVGHAEFTGGAGRAGNAVLLGHVTSRSLGNVFETLERARVGDLIQVSGTSGDFAYRVVDVRRVSRTDVSVLEPTATAAVSLITCTGRWLPQLQDYAERVVVRGELVQATAT